MKKTAKTDNSSDPKTLCYNILSTICILTLATVLAFSFFHITRSDPANIALIYILALIIIARITSGYVFGIISALFCFVLYSSTGALHILILKLIFRSADTLSHLYFCFPFH